MKEVYIPSADQKHKLHVVIWETKEFPKAIIQLSHGMIEYVKRYQEFAENLNDAGILVLGNDHLGHGKTAENENDFGYFCHKKLSCVVVEDLHRVTEYAKKHYKNVPIFLFGHSMGSFMARRYLMTYGKELAGAVISGTGNYTTWELNAGKVCAAVIGWKKGERYRSPFMKKLLFARNNKKIKNPNTENDWLTRETEIVERYNKDPYCTFAFTINGYGTLFDAITFIQKKQNVDKIPKDLPILMIAGLEDPVGLYGKSVKKVYSDYKKTGIQDIQLKLYEGCRHELTNEKNRQEVYQDIRSWIEKRLTKKEERK